jgi:Fe-S cluster assembly protein SufD
MTALIEKLLPETSGAGDAFDRLRHDARTVLMQQGLPHRKTENWRYMPLSVLEAREFAETRPDADDAALPELPSGVDGVLHLHDGVLDPARCRLPQGVVLTGLVPADVETEALERSGPNDAFAWLNLARLEQGWRLRIEKPLQAPLALVMSFSENFSGMVHPRLSIELASGAQAELVQIEHGGGEGFVNAVIDVHLGARARLLHAIERAGAATAIVQRIRAVVGAAAEYRAFILDGGGVMTRQDLIVELSEPGARGEIRGSAVLSERSLVDYHTAIHHRVGPSESREDFRILADDRATGVFNGRILIVPGADFSRSEMHTGNLLLSEQARVNIKPELEIHAEEVSASHGATVGQLDDLARFYLRSRGLSDAEAIALLKYGFAAAAFEGLDEEDQPLADWLRQRMSHYLGDGR